jgi:hypothetical protein
MKNEYTCSIDNCLTKNRRTFSMRGLLMHLELSHFTWLIKKLGIAQGEL